MEYPRVGAFDMERAELCCEPGIRFIIEKRERSDHAAKQDKIDQHRKNCIGPQRALIEKKACSDEDMFETEFIFFENVHLF